MAKVTPGHKLKAGWMSSAKKLAKLRKLMSDGSYQLLKRKASLNQFTNHISNPVRKVLLKHCQDKLWDGLEFNAFAIRPSHPLYLNDCLVTANKMGSTNNGTRSSMIKCFSNMPIQGMYLEKWKYSSTTHTISFLGETLLE